MIEIKEGQFRCERCGGVFDKEWSEEEARAEARELFPNNQNEPQSEICDDCFQEFMVWARQRGLAR